MRVIFFDLYEVVCTDFWLVYSNNKTPTGQLRQSDNICNMAFLPKGINNRENFGSVLAQETLLS